MVQCSLEASAQYGPEDPAGLWEGRTVRPVFPAPELVIRHCGVTGKRIPGVWAEQVAPRPGVLAGVGTAGDSDVPAGTTDGPLGRPAPSQRAAHGCGRYFFAQQRQKSRKTGYRS